MFNYSDISRVLDDIVETNEPPFNVAIIGKWGLGKSSLINLVVDKLKKNRNQYLIQEINAWKYEKESLRKVFLKQLWQGLSEQKVKSFEVIRREISEVINSEISVTPSTEGNKRKWHFLKIVVITVIITFIALIAYKAIQDSMCADPLPFFWRRVFISYCKNIGTVLIFPILVWLFKILLDDYHNKQTKKIELNFPIETTDDYEIFLETKIKEHLEKHKDLKIVTVIDDLDRLSIDKIVEALDALKAFVGFERCIFIVPFDDEIIKQALNKRRVQEFNEHDDVVESELILDKLFQFKVYLPPILDFDIQKYAFELAKQEIPDFFNEYCGMKTMEKVIGRVLIHPGVSTPRQVKKLINAFVNNFMIAANREKSGKIEAGLLTSEEGTMQIAKISVLQADFNSVYDLLFKDMDCINAILSFHRCEVYDSEIVPIYIETFFRKIDLDGGWNYELRNEYEPLVNFLTITEKYNVPSIAPFLYLAQDDISIQTGDELQRRTNQALTSGNIKTVRTILQESPNVANVIKYRVLRETNNTAAIISSSIMLFDSIADDFKNELANRIIERTLEVPFDELQEFYDVLPSNVFEIADCGENKDFSEDFLDIYLSVFTTKQRQNKEPFIGLLNYIVPRYSVLSAKTKESIKVLTTIAINSNEISAKDLFYCVLTKDVDIYKTLWGTEWYKKLCRYIDDENDFSADVIDHLKNAVNILKDEVDVVNLIAPLETLMDYAEMLSTISEILNIELEEETLKTMMPLTQATKIAEKLLKHDLSNNQKAIFSIFLGLPFEINEDNAEAFDDFALNFEDYSSMDEVLEYCGKKDFFEFLPNTTETLIQDVFKDDSNDSLLEKILKYFTSSMLEELFKTLTTKVRYIANNEYERELALLSILVNEDNCIENLDKLATETIIPQFASNYSHETYFDFVVQAMEEIQSSVTQETIDKYVDAILKAFGSKQEKCLNAINRINGKMSEEKFEEVFNKVISTSTASTFDSALDVIINHDSMRPTEDEDLTAYRNYLVNNLPISNDPNRILKTLRKSFSSIHGVEEMVTKALMNHISDKDVIVDTLVHFWENKNTSSQMIAKNILSIIEIENATV